MRIVRLLSIATCACLLGCAASAQAPDGPEWRVGRTLILRVETTLNINVPVKPDAGVEEQLRQAETARRAVYQMASRECAVLGEVFKADCRVQNLRLGSNVQDRRGMGPDQVFVNGAATYELWGRRTNP